MYMYIYMYIYIYIYIYISIYIYIYIYIVQPVCRLRIPLQGVAAAVVVIRQWRVSSFES